MDHSLGVLVLCTGNSSRSILCEALFNQIGTGRVRAWSAGSAPAGSVNPLALETLARHGIAAPGARSKSWDEFALPEAPAFDLVITVCDHAAGETCPVWPGRPARVHWGVADPAAVEPIEARRAAFDAAYCALRARVEALLALPIESMDRDALAAAAQRVHQEACG